MSPLLRRALEAIHNRTNVATGLSHPNDMNAAKEMFVLLHQSGEILLENEISSWAEGHGWAADDAKELGQLGAQIGMGKKPRIEGGPWWADGIIKRLSQEAEAE